MIYMANELIYQGSSVKNRVSTYTITSSDSEYYNEVTKP